MRETGTEKKNQKKRLEWAQWEHGLRWFKSSSNATRPHCYWISWIRLERVNERIIEEMVARATREFRVIGDKNLASAKFLFRRFALTDNKAQPFLLLSQHGFSRAAKVWIKSFRVIAWYPPLVRGIGSKFFLDPGISNLDVTAIAARENGKVSKLQFWKFRKRVFVFSNDPDS